MEINDEHSNLDPILARDENEEQSVQVFAIPDRALQVEAATLSLLEEKDESALQSYQNFSSIPRGDRSEWLRSEGSRKQREFDDYIRGGLINVLADPSVPGPQKEAIVNQARTGSFAPPDTASTLFQNAIIAPSKGETEVGSKVRESMASTAFKAAEMLEERQKIVNAAVGQRSGVGSQVTDLLSMFVPLEAGIMAGKVAAERGDSVAKAAILPGSYMKELSDKLQSLPWEERNSALRELATIVSQSSGLTTSANQLRTEAWMSELTSGVTTFDAYIENFFNLLDIAGVGIAVKNAPKGLSKARNSARMLSDRIRAETSKNADEWFEKTGRDVRMESPVVNGESKVSTPMVNTVPKTISDFEAKAENLKEAVGFKLTRDELEETRSSLQVVETQKLVPPKQATPAEFRAYMEAKNSREEALVGLRQKLDNHSVAVKAEEELPEVLNKIETLQGKIELAPAPRDPLAAAIDRAYNQSFMFTHNPRTPAFILNLTNPEKARNLHAQILMNEGDNLAQALHGTGRSEALVKSVAPQVTDTTGRVKKVVDEPESAMRKVLSAELGEAITNVQDGFRYTAAELASARANVVKDYTEQTGLKINDAMTSISYEGDRVIINGVYTNGQGGWTSAEDALSQARFALRDRGVTEDHFDLMKLDGDEFVPVKKDEVKDMEGIYAVRIKVEDRINDTDVSDWESLDVKRNWLDRFQTSGAGSSVSRYVFEPNSMLHKRLTGPMSVADDKSTIITNRLLEQFKSFTDQYVQLPNNLKKEVDEYIRDANVHERKFDPVALGNKFPQNVVDMLQEWKDSWDVMYLLENGEVIKMLDKEGYKFFQHSNIDAIIKERPKRYENNKAYDPATDTVSTLSKQEIDDLYSKGGYVGEFRRPMDLNGTTAEFMVVRNTPNEFARKFNPNDRVLNYRDGYYQVSYKTPKFIDETYVDSHGVSRTRTVGVAGSVKEAKDAVSRLSSQGGSSTFKYRGDERDVQRNADTYWDLNQSSGRIAQRHRGKLLENTVGFKTYGADDFIDNPADSAVRAATSMGGRLAMKEVIDTAKERFLNQYKHLLTGPDFQKRFPSSRDQIVMKGESTTKELSDARTTWEYINYMENGYINGMAEVSKRALNSIADALGEKGFAHVEKATRVVANMDVQGKVKGGVFAAYLATNPLRQWIVQSNQIWRLTGYSGVHFPKIFDLTNTYINGAIGRKLSPKQAAFKEFFDATGFEQSIHRSNLVRGSLLEASNRQTKAGQVADSIVSTGRSIGYDLGENLNNMASSAAVFDKYWREGKDVKDLTVRAEMQAEARAINRNMSYAGDMPYNQNSLAVAFTYMQVPHKFALQWADRSLSRAERARLIGADLTLWGLPGVALIQQIAGNDILPENANVRELVVEGLQSWFVNNSLSQIYGEKVGIDFSSLAPYDMDSWTKMMQGLLFDKGLSALVTNAPAGRVFGLSADSRLGYALKTTGMFFKDINEQEFTSVNIKDVADAWARMSSGYTNLQEARIMYQLRKVIDKQGRPIDDDVHPAEAIAKVFGFGTKDSQEYYETIIKAGALDKNWQAAAKSDAKLVMQMIRGLNEGDMQGARSVAMLTQTLTDASNFPSKQAQAKYLAALQAETQGSAWLTVNEKLAKVAGYPDPSQSYADLAKMAPLSEEEKAMYTDAMNKNFKFWKELEEANKE